MGVYMDPEWPLGQKGAAMNPPDSLLRRNGYGEATAFRLVNERLLAMAGADWNDPDLFLARRGSPAYQRRCLAAIGAASFGRLRRDYLDHSPLRRPAHWGWKDPRNSLTLPLWLEAFPDARILHVRRDPERIADSLLRREAAGSVEQKTPSTMWTRIAGAATDPVRLAGAVGRRLMPGGIESVPRPTLDRERCDYLTERYVLECVRYRAMGSHYEEIHYEDILRAPRLLAAQIAEFAGISPLNSHVNRAAEFVASDCDLTWSNLARRSA